MYIWSCDRRRFVDFMVNGKRLASQEVSAVDAIGHFAVNHDMISLVWKRNPAEEFLLPNAIIVAEGQVPDFLAWVSTYFRQFRPFTAHCRIVTPSQITFLAKFVDRSPPQLRSAYIGLIMTECISYTVGRTDLSRLPISAHFRTLSFAFSQSLMRYGEIFIKNNQFLEEVAKGWLKARDMANYASLELSSTHIQNVWALVSSATSGGSVNVVPGDSDPLLVEAIKEISETGRLTIESLRAFGRRCHIDFLQTNALMDGPREGRVKAVDIATRELAFGPDSTRNYRAFLVGYFTSRIQPGSLDHFPILFHLADSLRESFLWYGVCAGSAPNTSILNYGDGIGWILKRELERSSDWLERPDCDVALTEMILFFGNREGNKINLKTLTTGSLKVEIFPMVSTVLKWNTPIEAPVIAGRAPLPPTQAALFSDNSSEVRQDVLELLRKMEETSMSLNAIRKQVEKKFGEKLPSKSKQRNNR